MAEIVRVPGKGRVNRRGCEGQQARTPPYSRVGALRQVPTARTAEEPSIGADPELLNVPVQVVGQCRVARNGPHLFTCTMFQRPGLATPPGSRPAKRAGLRRPELRASRAPAIGTPTATRPPSLHCPDRRAGQAAEQVSGGKPTPANTARTITSQRTQQSNRQLYTVDRGLACRRNDKDCTSP